MEGVDFVVHTAAALPLYSPEDIHTTDVEGRVTMAVATQHLDPGLPPVRRTL